MKKLINIKGAWPYLFALFLNSFVDLGHKIIIQNTIFKSYDGELQILLTTLVNGLILLPFILLLTPAGFISDKHPKNKVMRISACFAVLLTLAITACYYLGLFWPAFAMTFLLAVQSTFYSPAKYGYIKPLFGKEKLAQANGVVQAASIIAILTGTVVYSLFFETLYQAESTSPAMILQTMAPLAWLLVINSIIELIMAYRLPTLEEHQEKQFDWARYRSGSYMKESLKPLLTHKVIRLSIIGLTMFWSIGQMLLASFPAYAKESLAETNTLVIQATMAATGIGIAVGSWVAGRFSRNHIEIGLIPFGAVGVAVSLWCLPLMQSSMTQALCFLSVGLMGGLFIVPLNALIQFHAGRDEMGKVLAVNNWVQSVGMATFLAITACFAYFGFNSEFLLTFTAVVAMLGGLYTIYKLPQSLVRLVLNWSISRHYKVSVQGMKNIPEQGGVLLLGNHVSWVDWAILQIACPRPVRFVMDRKIYSRWYISWFFKALGCIPIDASASSKRSLTTIAQILDNGDVVALFPEGHISRNGHLSEFKRGFELACKKAQQPLKIVPFYIRGLWGSKFSRSSDKLKEVRTQGMFRDLVVAFAPAMEKQSNAQQVKSQVFNLSVSSWQEHVAELPNISNAWIDTVKRVKTKTVLSDNTGMSLTAQQTLVGAISLSKHIKKNVKQDNIGLLLPTSAGGVIANMASLLAGKTLVNLNYTASQSALVGAIDQAQLSHVYTSKRFLKKLQQRGIDLSSALQTQQVIYVEDLFAMVSQKQKIGRLLAIKVLPAFALKWLYATKTKASQPAAILFSSGSEGTPKGVMLSQQNIMANLKQVSDVLNTQETDVVLGSLPLFHAFGLTVTQLMPLVEGLPLVCCADPTDAVAVAKTVAKHEATIMCGTSTFLRLYAKNRKVDPLMFASLRIVVAGAEKLNEQVKTDFESKFNKKILEGYGTTETTPVASVNMPDQLHQNDWQVQVGGKAGTVGMPLPGTSFKIVDPETFQPLAIGEAGLVLIGGAQVMLGYLGAPEKTQQVIKEIDNQRWYVSGDKGKLDEDGFLTILDRYSRFAKIGGEMISLGAVEQAVLNAVQQDIDVVAIACKDPQKGENIVLLHQGEIDKKQIKQTMLADGCNPLMLPKSYFMVEEVPKLGSGKTDFSQAKKLATSLIEGS
ncbi:acyl-[ACP]--phospholipid O-acyltransferase [Psychromonas sp. psych-6C06]|uniref:acyl-[ACP]--phospholipid O-acyltransferase n=1 Tax=Psychromonas sp. psych-6C06 TaxID=2058089 RepID=UPI000C33E5AC|nr:acyl-[ACP]--phospholipid O-acyltransferase [Psychromonas sp. psych-6C06]PKF61578.1 acyl-[ACP]--phospholipid O-acyltransferase [Psychromonas sp. psych-6C06]